MQGIVTLKRPVVVEAQREITRDPILVKAKALRCTEIVHPNEEFPRWSLLVVEAIDGSETAFPCGPYTEAAAALLDYSSHQPNEHVDVHGRMEKYRSLSVQEKFQGITVAVSQDNIDGFHTQA